MSKFSAAMNAAKDRSAAVAAAVDRSGDSAPAGTQNEKPRTTNRLVQQSPRRGRAPVRSPGRPPGKRSSATTTQVTAYIESSTHVETKIRLLQNARNHGQKQDFSGLVQHLLTEWLKRQQ